MHVPRPTSHVQTKGKSTVFFNGLNIIFVYFIQANAPISFGHKLVVGLTVRRSQLACNSHASLSLSALPCRSLCPFSSSSLAT